MRAFGKASEMDMLQDVAPSGGSIHEEAKTAASQHFVAASKQGTHKCNGKRK